MSSNCPLCSSMQWHPVSNLAMADIWNAYRQNYQIEFSESVVAAHTLADQIEVVECDHCGLQFFHPAIPGSAEFYREMTTSDDIYYNAEKWDFRFGVSFVKAGDAVLDIGCGSGQFVAAAQQKGAHSIGIDTNPAAIATAKSLGRNVDCVDLDSFAKENPQRFDVVSAFQVVEHIDPVLSFVNTALTCLKPKGLLIIAVPNRNRSTREPFEPMDCPPHHMSRWSERQMLQLAKAANLSVVKISREPASLPNSRLVFRQRLAPKYCYAPWMKVLGRAAFHPLLYQLYEKWGLLDKWKYWGMSLMGVFHKR